MTVTDENGSVVAEQNFDAWGRKRNVNTWDYANVGTVPDWLYRGFTGHEHLPEFGLINMNARLYDPVLGRMLSVDNYIGGGTQGLNRYSYARNNPLNNIDPDGNNPVGFDFNAFNASMQQTMNSIMANANSIANSIFVSNQTAVSTMISGFLPAIHNTMSNAQGYYFEGLNIAAKYGIINNTYDEEWKPMYQSDLRKIAFSLNMSGNIGDQWEQLFEGYIADGGTFGAHADHYLDAGSVKMNKTSFNEGGQTSVPDAIGDSKGEIHRPLGFATKSVIYSDAVNYELKAWRYGSTIFLKNPYSPGSNKVYQPEAHINNLSARFGPIENASGNNQIAKYLVYVTPAGVTVDPGVWNHGTSKSVYVMHLIGQYRSLSTGGYQWRLIGNPIMRP